MDRLAVVLEALAHLLLVQAGHWDWSPKQFGGWMIEGQFIAATSRCQDLTMWDNFVVVPAMIANSGSEKRVHRAASWVLCLDLHVGRAAVQALEWCPAIPSLLYR